MAKSTRKRSKTLTKKARLALLFEKRSKASKKGWRTRRKTKRETERAYLGGLTAREVKALQKKQAKASSRTKRAHEKKLIAKIREQNRELAKMQATIRKLDEEREKMARRHAVLESRQLNLETIEQETLAGLRKDGRKALRPSILRHLPDERRLWRRLHAAYKEDQVIFTAEAMMIAQEYDVTMAEVYTLYFSP